jgi:hypothetical protein
MCPKFKRCFFGGKKLLTDRAVKSSDAKKVDKEKLAKQSRFICHHLISQLKTEVKIRGKKRKKKGLYKKVSSHYLLGRCKKEKTLIIKR